jgi:hypothetical protein
VFMVGKHQFSLRHQPPQLKQCWIARAGQELHSKIQIVINDRTNFRRTVYTEEARNTVTGANSSSLASPFIKSSGLHRARFFYRSRSVSTTIRTRSSKIAHTQPTFVLPRRIRFFSLSESRSIPLLGQRRLCLILRDWFKLTQGFPNRTGHEIFIMV